MYVKNGARFKRDIDPMCAFILLEIRYGNKTRYYKSTGLAERLTSSDIHVGKAVSIFTDRRRVSLYIVNLGA